MIRYSVEKEYQGMIDAYEKAGGDRRVLETKDVAKLVVHENRVLASDGIQGLKVETKETKNGVNVKLTVEEGTRFPTPSTSASGSSPKRAFRKSS